MGCVSCCSKVFLITINVLFMILSLAITGTGVLILAAGNNLQHLVKGYLGKLPTQLQNMNVEGYDGDVDPTVNLLDSVKPLAIGLVVFGLLMFVISTIGCCGASCSVRMLLIVYIIILVVFLVVEIVLFALAYSGMIWTHVRKGLSTKLREYKGITDFEANSLVWTFLMLDMKCCGLDSHEDFASAQSWDREIMMGGNTYSDIEIPLACCKMEGSYPDLRPKDLICLDQPDDLNSNMDRGCWDEIMYAVNTYKVWLLVAAIVIMSMQVLLVVLAVVAVTQDNSVSPI